MSTTTPSQSSAGDTSKLRTRLSAASRPYGGHRPLAFLLVGAVLAAWLLAAPTAAAAQTTATIGGYNPSAITFYYAGSPGARAGSNKATQGDAALTNYCHGSGGGFSPQIQIAGGGAHRSSAYTSSDQRVWYRAYVQRWNGSAWAWYGGGQQWQQQTIPYWSSYPAEFWGENVPVARGSWYRVVEEYVFEVNGARIGEARNYFNQWAYGLTGSALHQATNNTPSACFIQ
jgi:hypothetical protein